MSTVKIYFFSHILVSKRKELTSLQFQHEIIEELLNSKRRNVVNIEYLPVGAIKIVGTTERIFKRMMLESVAHSPYDIGPAPSARFLISIQEPYTIPWKRLLFKGKYSIIDNDNTDIDRFTEIARNSVRKHLQKRMAVIPVIKDDIDFYLSLLKGKYGSSLYNRLLNFIDAVHAADSFRAEEKYFSNSEKQFTRSVRSILFRKRILNEDTTINVIDTKSLTFKTLYINNIKSIKEFDMFDLSTSVVSLISGEKIEMPEAVFDLFIKNQLAPALARVERKKMSKGDLFQVFLVSLDGMRLLFSNIEWETKEILF